CTLRMAVNGGRTATSTLAKYFSGSEKASFCTRAMASRWLRFIFQLPAMSGVRAISSPPEPRCARTRPRRQDRRGSSQLRGHQAGDVDQPVAVTPLVVVPAHDLHLITDHLGQPRVED